MFQMSLIYIILWLSFQSLINCQMIPKQRQWHTATYIDNKLYILGGAYINSTSASVDASDVINEFFYIDVSSPFNTKALSWHDLSDNTIPTHFGATTAVGGAKNNTLFLYGGYTADTAMALVYTFKPIDKVWNAPKVIGGVRKRGFVGVNNNEKMYIWGGLLTSGEVDTNDMLTLDMITLGFGKGSIIGAPSARHNYGGVLLPNQNIIYFGGYNGTNELSLTQIYIYDTIGDKWTTQQTMGTQISERDGFSAVLGLDGQRIIIFGGTASASNVPPVYEDSLYVLSLANFAWTVPRSSGNKPKSRVYHTANVIGKYMVISFGRGYDRSDESDILLLDISNEEEYIWTNAFDLSSQSTSTIQTGPDNRHSPNLVLIGTIIGSFVFGALLSFGGFFLYKRNKNKQKQKDVMRIPSNNIQDERNTRNDYEKKPSATNHKSVMITPSFSHYGSEENLSRQSINDLKNELKQEIIQDLRQEIIRDNSLVKNN